MKESERGDKMEKIQWLFDGLGTEIVSLLLAGLIGGFAGYKLACVNFVKQKQQAGENANQEQEIEVSCNTDNKEVDSIICQIQKGKSGSVQSQIGKVNINE